MAYLYPIDFVDTRWRVTDGDIYVSFLGHDQFGTGSPARPFRTLQQAITVALTGARIVVGTGEYSETVNGLGKNCKLIADGTVICKGLSSATAFFNMGSESVFQDFVINGYQTAIDGAVKDVTQCEIEGCALQNFSGSLRSTVLVNVSIVGINPVRFFNCTLVGVTCLSSGAISRLESCHIGTTSTLHLSTPALTYFNFCNQQPGSTILINGNPLATPALVNAAHPLFQLNGLATNPKFNQAEIGDYTLTNTSLLRATGSRKKPIGALGEAIKFSIPEAFTSGSASGVVLNANGFAELGVGRLNGILTTGIVDLGFVRPMRTLHLFANQIFSDAVLTRVSVLTDRLLPSAIAAEMRWGDTIDELNAASYNLMIWDKVVSVDEQATGNGQLSFVVPEESWISARFVQIKVTLTKAEELILLSQESGYELLQETGSGITI
jgi:hypothetical protein